MADQQIIREFLVALGFKTDAAGLKKFTGGVDGATKSVFKLVAAIESSALAITAQVTKFASGMEEMYFAAERTGASATGLKAAAYAAQNLGASADQAKASIEGVARFMRDMPGGEGLIQSLGVATRDANGSLIDTGEILMNLGKQFAGMDWYQAKAYASNFGIDDQMLMAIRSGDFEKFAQDYRNISQISGLEKATADSHEFMKSMRELTSIFETFGIQIDAVLLKKVGPELDDFKQWFIENGPMIADTIGTIASAVLTLAHAINTIAADWFDKLKPAVDWVSDSAVGKAAGELWQNSKGMVSAFMDYYGPKEESKEQVTDKKSAVEFFKRMGWSHDQASGIVANLNAESSMRADAVGDSGKAYGVAQWHPDRQANFAKWAGKDIKQSSLDEQLQFVNYELTQGAEQKAGALLKASRNAQEAGSAVSRYYERPLASTSEAEKRGAAAVQLSQTTNINISGVNDASAAGRAVEDAQSRVNQQMTRNMQTAVQ